ncbi:hypothetical protein SAMN05660284_02243 [Formivibrio citricus]|uniref:Uncharacterized protein n=1 Tax=Formivibrio citricus TaxID=83765 RepID=A0A1I5BTY6_9NEIS|nr:hypothetical protein [Formivibrio citricus]SFN78170.1 hypothetical protein SAMN05660284_02243 [Formivibrio citricus]
MNLSAGLHITPKGVDEVKNRVYKLSIRKRSVLILLEKPQTVEYVIQKSVFHKDEILEEINSLIRDGFLTASGDVPGGAPAAKPSEAQAAAGGASGGGNFQLSDDIILSEAKFLLVDFCVDTFGTQSQSYVDEIGECKNAKNLYLSLRNIYAATEKQYPNRVAALLGVIKEINETA